MDMTHSAMKHARSESVIEDKIVAREEEYILIWGESDNISCSVSPSGDTTPIIRLPGESCNDPTAMA